MKYRLFDGGYESFLDHRVPEEYKDIVVDELPPEYLIEPDIAPSVRDQKIDKLLETIEQGATLTQIKDELGAIKEE